MQCAFRIAMEALKVICSIPTVAVSPCVFINVKRMICFEIFNVPFPDRIDCRELKPGMITTARASDAQST
jgi:hypothetical protein